MGDRITLLANFVDINPEGIMKAYHYDKILYIDIISCLRLFC